MIKNIFDDIDRNIELLGKSENDNEALRHDLIIRPFFTNPMLLGWDGLEIVSQKNVTLPKEMIDSYIWKNAVPKKRIADALIIPYGMFNPIAVIEEKRRQICMQNLLNYSGQLTEYQYLHNTVWGVLTDGEKWIIKRNNEIYHVFSNFQEVKQNFKDIKECLGRENVVERIKKYHTADIIFVQPSPNIHIVITTGDCGNIFDFHSYFKEATIDRRDLALNLSVELNNKIVSFTYIIEERFRLLISLTLATAYREPLNIYCGYCDLKTSLSNDDLLHLYSMENLNRWISTYKEMLLYHDKIKEEPITRENYCDFLIKESIYHYFSKFAMIPLDSPDLHSLILVEIEKFIKGEKTELF